MRAGAIRLGLAIAVALGLGAGAAGATAPAQPAWRLVRLSPDRGPAGTVAVLTGRWLQAGPSAQPPPTALVCWVRCGAGGWIQTVDLYAAGNTFQLTAQLPAFRWRSGPRAQAPLPTRLRPGTYRLWVCLEAQRRACAAQPQGQALFQLTAAAPAVSWAAIPQRVLWHPLVPLSRVPGFALSPSAPLRLARCQVQPASGLPQLRVSLLPAGRQQIIPLPIRDLGEGPGGEVGCRLIALDPKGPDTYYVAGLRDPHTATTGLASPPPFYTTDGGRTWSLVPTPPGFDALWGWTGVTATPEGVAFWYSRAFFGQPPLPAMFAEEVTLDGGHLWLPIPLVCPRQGPCLWREAGLNPSLNGGPHLMGAVFSLDHGRQWHWARYAGMALSGGTPVIAGQAVLWPAALAWPRGTEGLPGQAQPIPLLYSPDGGAHWAWVRLPPPPPGWGAGSLAPPMNRRLQVLPDGALLLQVWGAQPAAWLLPPRARSWCPLAGSVPGGGAFLEVGEQLVWAGPGGLQLTAAQRLSCRHPPAR